MIIINVCIEGDVSPLPYKHIDNAFCFGTTVITESLSLIALDLSKDFRKV